MASLEKTKGDVRNFLQRHRTASLATVAANGEPQVATVNYVLDDDFNFFFVARKQSRKFANLERDKKVGILVGDDPQIPAIVEMQGEAEMVQDARNINEYFSKQTDLGDKSWDMLFKTAGVNFVLFKVKITWIRWLNLDMASYPEMYMKDFVEIVP